MVLKKELLGWYLVPLISFSPIIPWLLIVPVSTRFGTFYDALTSLSEIAALIGITMFSLSFVLSTRWKWLENLFGGMNKVYVAHHLFGGISFMFLLFHPLAYATAYIPLSVKLAATKLLPGDDWSINFGIAALLLMMSLLILTFFISLPYQVWRFTHKFLGAAFFIATLHGFYVTGGDVSQYMNIKVYMFIIFAIGVCIFVYKTLLGRYLIKKYTYTVSGVKTLEDTVVEITLAPKEKPMPYTPGQFVFLSFKSAGVTNETHPFSISSSDPNVLMFTVKAEGDYTKTLSSLQVGNIAYIEGSFGRFSYNRAPSKKQVWIAGGIGITPFISMARSITDATVFIDLYYSVRTEKEAVYLTDLQQIASQKPNFKIIPFFTKTQGRLSAETISKTSDEITKRDIFICGPPPMMYSMREQLQKLGVPKDHIHTEEFSVL